MAPFIAELDDELPLAEQLAAAHDQAREYWSDTASNQAPTPPPEANASFEKPVAEPDKVDKPASASTPLSDGIADFGEAPPSAPPSATPPQPTTSVPPVAPPPPTTPPPPVTPPQSATSPQPIAPPQPIASAPAPSAPEMAVPPQMPAGPVSNAETFTPPPQPETFVPPPAPDTSAVPPAPSKSSPDAPGSAVPPPAPSMPPVPPPPNHRRAGRRKVYIISGLAVATVAVILVVVFFVLGDGASRQLGLSADWRIEEGSQYYRQTRAMQVRLRLQNRTAKPIFIEPTTQDPFNLKDEHAGMSKSERMAMEALEKQMARQMGVDSQKTPRCEFKLQAAIGKDKHWRVLRPMGWRAEIEGGQPGVRNAFNTYSGWTIPANKTLVLTIDVEKQSRSDPKRSYGRQRKPQPGNDPGMLRVHAVRLQKNARLGEFTSSPPGQILKEWKTPW